jgi:hypothetical protein
VTYSDEDDFIFFSQTQRFDQVTEQSPHTVKHQERGGEDERDLWRKKNEERKPILIRDCDWSDD